MKVRYSEIKNSYLEIKNLLEDKSGNKVENLNTKIAFDLGLYGDDNIEFLEEFIKNYKLNFNNFNYQEHFDDEAELFLNIKWFIPRLLLFPLNLSLTLINFFRKAKIRQISMSEYISNNKLDLTFGDLITSKLKGEFCLRKHLPIEL